MGWILVLMIGVPAVISRIIIYRKNPDLLTERGQYREQQGIKKWDMLLASIVGLFGPLVTWIIAGLDRNFGWSEVPVSIQWIAVIVLLLSSLFSNWALIANKYFSAVVRIQADRGHTVVTDGPYHYVRHPGYSGGAIANIVMPLMLGSLWALIPAILTIIILVIRTAKEDQTLIDELPGYVEYAEVTQHRLLPGIW
jgi:protein-S-isoprenylcysteine O-methyltransferase Ste14